MIEKLIYAIFFTGLFAFATLSWSTDSTQVHPTPVQSKTYVCEKTASYSDTDWKGSYDCGETGSIDDCDENWVMLGVNFTDMWHISCKTRCAKLTTKCDWINT